MEAILNFIINDMKYIYYINLCFRGTFFITDQCEQMVPNRLN